MKSIMPPLIRSPLPSPWLEMTLLVLLIADEDEDDPLVFVELVLVKRLLAPRRLEVLELDDDDELLELDDDELLTVDAVLTVLVGIETAVEIICPWPPPPRPPRNRGADSVEYFSAVVAPVSPQRPLQPAAHHRRGPDIDQRPRRRCG